MALEYSAVQWNRQKRLYDFVLAGGVGLFLILFAVVTKVLFPLVTDEIMLIRAFAAAAFVLLHIILCIGPLCRLDERLLPLLYNRRHAGVTMCLLAIVHAALVVITYHGGGDINPILSIFKGSPITRSIAGIPFQPFGFFALVILLLMAATSHDFWLANLSAPVWKALHMLVYVAYGLLVLHVMFGVLQGESSPAYLVAMALGLVIVLGLHVTAARIERPRDEALSTTSAADGFADACAVADIPENRACIVCLSGERVAIFKYDGRISAVSNLCQHQNGPLGEGKVLDGCITCPWHGYQYSPETGASPPPFVEKVPTFNVRVRNGRVLVHAKPNRAGTKVKPAFNPNIHIGSNDEFYIGWEEKASPGISKGLRKVVGSLIVIAVIASVVLATAQRMIGSSVFEWGNPKTFSGFLQSSPYPHLLMPRPGDVGGQARFSTYYLVAPWKFGLDRSAIAPLDGKSVSLQGTLIYRGNQTMIEVQPGTIQVTNREAMLELPKTISLGKQTLSGEIVDSKCFLGVMNPGQLIPHRACAIRCISGGVPPVLLVRQATGPAIYLLLVSAEGKPVNKQVLDLVAEPVEITGEVERQGELLILRADPATYRKL